MTRFYEAWHEFSQNVLKALAFFLFIYTGLRLLFLAVFFHQWWGASTAELLKTFVYGFRINLKSAGLAVLIWVFFCGFPALFRQNQPWLKKIQTVLINSWIVLIFFLGLAEIPYFQNFNSGYDHMMFQGIDENPLDLVGTLAADWLFWGLLVLWLVGSFLLIKLWKWWMAKPILPLPSLAKKIVPGLGYSLLLLAGLITLAVYCRFGGSLTYKNSLHWENYAVVSNDTLNEAILDSLQGLYRAQEQRELILENSALNLSPAELKNLLKQISTQPPEFETSLLSDYIKREAKGARIPKPRHVFILLGESQGEWPLLPEYADLHLADHMKEITRRDDSVWIQNVLPNGPYTVMGIQSVVIGIADAKQSPQFRQESYRQVYETGLAPQVKQLGYQTHFWYGGPSTWEHLEKFVRAQGFDAFSSMGDFNTDSAARNVWGISDTALYRGIETQINGDTPTVHVIMTTSNHAPYSVDYLAEGFPIEEIKKQLTPQQQNNQRLLNQLGHYWYADREAGKFVAAMRKKYPDSLFILTGDHGARMSLESLDTHQKWLCIPIVISGNGIKPEFFPPNNAASQLQIVPTLLELIAPANFTYYSLLPSLTEPNLHATNSEYWMTHKTMGSRLDNSLSPANSPDIALRNKQWEDGILAYSWWRVMRGNQLQNQ